MTLESTFLFEWSNPPSNIIYEDYYIMALIDTSIEIKSIKTGTLLQILDIGATILQWGNLNYAANSETVWRLLPTDFEMQVRFANVD